MKLRKNSEKETTAVRSPVFIDGIGPPLRQIEEDVLQSQEWGSAAGLGVDDSLALIREVYRLTDKAGSLNEALGFAAVVLRNLQGFDKGFCPMCQAADVEDLGVHVDGCVLGAAVEESFAALDIDDAQASSPK